MRHNLNPALDSNVEMHEDDNLPTYIHNASYDPFALENRRKFPLRHRFPTQLPLKYIVFYDISGWHISQLHSISEIGFPFDASFIPIDHSSSPFVKPASHVERKSSLDLSRRGYAIRMYARAYILYYTHIPTIPLKKGRAAQAGLYSGPGDEYANNEIDVSRRASRRRIALHDRSMVDNSELSRSLFKAIVTFVRAFPPNGSFYTMVRWFEVAIALRHSRRKRNKNI